MDDDYNVAALHGDLYTGEHHDAQVHAPLAPPVDHTGGSTDPAYTSGAHTAAPFHGMYGQDGGAPFRGVTPSLDETSAEENRVNPGAGAPTPHAEPVDGPAEEEHESDGARAAHAGSDYFSSMHSGLETIAPPVVHELEHTRAGHALPVVSTALTLNEMREHGTQYVRAEQRGDERGEMRASSELALDGIGAFFPPAEWARSTFDLINHDGLGGRTAGEIMADQQYDQLQRYEHSSLGHADRAISNAITAPIHNLTSPDATAMGPNGEMPHPLPGPAPDPTVGPTNDNAHTFTTPSGAAYEQ
jgi:hypothetical protein